MKTILVVEDDIDIHNIINKLLEKERYMVLNAYSGTEAMLVLEKEDIDLILLDLMLPGINGEEIIKNVKNIPIIVITAKVALEDKINSLLNGANDFITKPFKAEELLARIKVQLRINEHEHENRSLKYKELLLNNDSHNLYINGEKIYLTKTEYIIMEQLLLNPRQVVTKSKLIEEMNKNTIYCDENSLKVHLSHIRKKIREISNKEYIESVWGIGFKMYD